MAISQLTVKYTLDGIIFNNGPDVDGNIWYGEMKTGWFGSAATRNNRENRPWKHGTFRVPVFRQERILAFEGTTICPSRVARNNAEHKLAGFCSDPSTLYTLSVSEEAGTMIAEVELDGEISITPLPGGQGFEWSVQLACPNPLKYSNLVQTASTPVPTTTGGLDWTDPTGLDWTDGVGLDWGDSTSTGNLTMVNNGTAETWPIYTINGNTAIAQLPRIINISTGQTLFYNDTIHTGETLVIDTSPHNRKVEVNGVDQRNKMFRLEWFAIPAHSSVTVSFNCDVLSPGAILIAQWSDAYY